MEPTAFVKEINDREKDFLTIADVTIGHGAPSTTLVPELHIVPGGLEVYDVPGFKDTDASKQIIINILHKCLLNNLASGSQVYRHFKRRGAFR